MFGDIIINVVVLSGIAVVSAIIIYVVSKKFVVIEDSKVDEVEAILPGINCGGCGRAGCHDFAKACVNASAEEFVGLFCPVGGAEIMKKVAVALGLVTIHHEKKIAVLKCQGTCQNAPDKIIYTGLKSCRLASKVTVGKSGCPHGCMRFGDCTRVCKFDALHIDCEKGIPVVDERKCTACGACVNICPRKLYELRPRGVDNKRIYVACSNQQKAIQAKKNCKVACIACQKCTKFSDLIKVENNLSYIPATVDAISLGEELAKCCPSKSIIYTGEVQP